MLPNLAGLEATIPGWNHPCLAAEYISTLLHECFLQYLRCINLHGHFLLLMFSTEAKWLSPHVRHRVMPRKTW